MARRAKPWLRSRDQVWCVWHDGTQVVLKTPAGQPIRGADRKVDAEKAFYRVKAEWDDSTNQNRDMTLLALSVAFLENAVKHLEPATAENYRQQVVPFVNSVGEKFLAEQVKPFHVSKWVDSRSWSQNTRASALGILFNLFSWGLTQGLIAKNPVANMKRPAFRRRQSVLSATQAAAVIEGCKCEPFRAVLVALRETGCRPGEVYSLTRDRVNLEAGTWEVVDKIRRKTGEMYRTIYLSPRMIEESRRQLGQHDGPIVYPNSFGRKWSNNAAWNQIKKIKHALNYGAECVLYSFRHLYITDALERGIPAATVAQLVGHRDLQMIMRIYSRLGDRTSHLRESAAAIGERTAPPSIPVPRPANPAAASSRLARRKTSRPKRVRSRKPRTT